MADSASNSLLLVVGDRERAIRALAGFPLPAGLFDGGVPQLNDAWRTSFGPELPPSFAAAVERVLETRRGETFATLDAQLPTHRGYFAVTIEPIGDAAIVACTDVTDRVLAEDLGVDERVPALWDAYANRAWRTTIRATLSEAVHPADLVRCNTVMWETLRRLESASVDVRLRVHDDYRWHRLRFVKARDGRVSCSAVDIHAEHEHDAERSELISQARTALDDAERANRLKDELLATVSHELRAPLTTLLLWERVLRENTGDEAARNQALDAIHHSAVAQARLIADLVDVARGITGKLYLDIRVVALEELLHAACDAARPLAIAKSIDLSCKFTPVVGGIHGDATRLRQVLDNLLLYALKATPSGGKVAVNISRRGRSVVIEIEDSGRGIPAEALSRIFDPFGGSDDALSRDSGALGLSIAKQIIDLHRGTLTVFSRGVDKGTKFTLTLPSAGNSRAPTPPAGARRAPRLDGARVLVIDDDKRVCDALGLLLARAGVAVDTAESAAMGRTRIVANEPHVVICDIAMPGEDGYTFVRKLRSDGWTFPAIALTAYATDVDARRAVEAGFDIHIPKPISFERLVISLSELLGARRGE